MSSHTSIEPLHQAATIRASPVATSNSPVLAPAPHQDVTRTVPTPTVTSDATTPAEVDTVAAPLLIVATVTLEMGSEATDNAGAVALKATLRLYASSQISLA